jgi:signal transduction histidine kinase
MDEFLDYGSPAAEGPSPYTLEAVVRQAASACARLAKQCKVELDIRCVPGLAPIPMDPRRLRKALHNVIENAVQHSPEGGTVAIRVEREAFGERDGLRCEVADSGPGIPAEDLPRLFEPFFTRRRGRTGLGLSIAQRIVEEHGGRIFAENRPQGGTAVALVFVAKPAQGPDEN